MITLYFEWRSYNFKATDAFSLQTTEVHIVIDSNGVTVTTLSKVNNNFFSLLAQKNLFLIKCINLFNKLIAIGAFFANFLKIRTKIKNFNPKIVKIHFSSEMEKTFIYERFSKNYIQNNESWNLISSIDRGEMIITSLHKVKNLERSVQKISY